MVYENLIAPKQYNIVMEFEKYAQDHGRKAIILEDESGHIQEITYNQLMKNANKIGNALGQMGLEKGDKLLVMLPRCVETYEVYIAALKTGIIIIPCSEMLRAKDLEYRINHGEAKAVVSFVDYTSQFEGLEQYGQLKKLSVGGEAKGWNALEEMKRIASDELEISKTTREDIAFLPYTSGTTGNPKAVMHTHGWGYAHMRTAPENWLSIKEGDTVWATAAPGWQKWVWSPFLSVLGSGATGYVYQGRFEPSKYMGLLEKNEVNVFCCTPTEYRLIAKLDNLSEYRLDTLHSAVSAGEPLNREVIDQFQKYFNITVRDGYGQTENTLLLGFLKGMEVRPGSMGKPTPGNDVTLINQDGKPVEPGVVGDIAIPKDAPALFKGYYKDEERTAKAYRGNYYVTGDQAVMDEEGYFWFEGRSDDIIISSGYTIGPFEVEDALVKHQAVKECAVVASPDEERGNVVKAFVVLKESEEADEILVKELQEHVKKLAAPYKYPRIIEFTDELPKTTSGKIRRIDLRRREASSNSR